MLILIQMVIAVSFGSAKIFEGYMITPYMYQQDSWFYLGRETLSPGSSLISLQTSIKGVPFSQFSDIQFAAINQSEWNSNQVLKCKCNPSKSINHVLKMNGEPNYANITITQTEPKLYYFVFRDCQSKINGEKQNYQLQLLFKLTILNNESHLGHYQNVFFLVMMLVSTLMLAYKVKKEGQKTEEKDWIQIGLFVGLLLQVIGLVSKIISFVVGWISGYRLNLIAFNIIYSTLGSFGDSLIATILLFISFGWTIIFIEVEDYEKFIPPIAGFSFLHILLSILGVANQSLHNKYHLYDSIPGIILIVVKIITALIFIYGTVSSFKKSSPMQRTFLFGFSVTGFLYILIIPITYFVCQFGISEGKQQHYAIIIKQSLNVAFNILFAYNIVNPDSIYRSNRKRHTFLPVDEKFY